MTGLLTPVQLLTSLAGCNLGAIVAQFGLGALLWPSAQKGSQAQQAALKPLIPVRKLRFAEHVAIEALVAGLYLVCILVLIKRMGRPLTGIAALIALVMAGKKWTGPGMDPANVLARSVVWSDYTHTGRYMLGSILGGLVGGKMIASFLGSTKPALSAVLIK
mmetsp:Transcript_18777/g.20966  ORF Transcript_18777/g.20966 Transcript_18777/m.20966 type:complete len:162 (+) Transcript_18777:3-488(+)